MRLYRFFNGFLVSKVRSQNMKIEKLRKNFQKIKKQHESENQNSYSVVYC